MVDWTSIIRFLPTVAILGVLCYILKQCARVTSSLAASAGQYGSDQKEKVFMMEKIVFNFYVVVGLCLVVIVDYLNLIGTDLFTMLFLLGLGGLGLKLVLVDLIIDPVLRSLRRKTPA